MPLTRVADGQGPWPISSNTRPDIEYCGEPPVTVDGGSASGVRGEQRVLALPRGYFGTSAKSTCTATELLVCPGMIDPAELSPACSAMTGRGAGGGTAPGR